MLKNCLITCMGCFFFFSCLTGVSQSACLNFSTYFGKTAQDEIKGVCIDNQRNTYVIGTTTNTDIPVTSGAYQMTLKGGYEAFLCKFDSCGNLDWCTYLGSSGFDSGEKIVYSNDNSIVICGYSNGADLPTTPGCFQSSSNGDYDCFIGKFSLNGSPLWISYFGASAADFAYDIKTDLFNNIVIGGTSMSTVLYTNSSSFQQTFAGATDAYIARFSPSGNLRFCTFYGGTGSEDIHALATDVNCNIIGTGGSFSSNLNMSAGCMQPASNGGMEVYVIKLDSTGQRIFSTYVGGSSTDDAFGVVSDPLGNIYVSGHTTSTNFTTTAGAYQSTINGSNDAYCLRLNPSGVLQWSTLIGGSSTDLVSRMTIDQYNELTILINSQSSDFPMMGILNYTTQSGASDNVLVKLTQNGVPFWSTFIGGSQGKTPYDLVNLSSKKVALAGETSSADYPLTGNIYQNTNGGFTDGFLTLYETQLSPAASVKEQVNSNCTPNVSVDHAKKMLFVFSGECFRSEHYSIRDLAGRNVKDGLISNDQIEIAELSQGVFVLVLLDNSGFEKHLKFSNY